MAVEPEPPLSPGEPAGPAAQPSWRNIQPDGSAAPSAQTLPSSTPPADRSLKWYQAPTCQANA